MEFSEKEFWGFENQMHSHNRSNDGTKDKNTEKTLKLRNVEVLLHFPERRISGFKDILHLLYGNT